MSAATTGQVQLVAVQMTLDLADYWTREAFEAKVRAQMDEVAARTDPDLPTLVVFPEDVGLMLVVQGLERRLASADTIEAAINRAVRANMVPLAWTRLRRQVSWVPALMLNRHRLVAETYFEVFSSAAREYGVYLVAGSVVLPPYAVVDGVAQWRAGPTEHRVYNTSYLFGPDGLILGKQDKVFLIELEEEAALDLESGSLEALRVFPTPVGDVGIAICLDAFQDEVVDRLAAQGAQILVQPSANPGPWHAEQQRDWLRSSFEKVAVDGRLAYAVNPMLNGPLWDIAFYGQSSIVARAALPAGPDGGSYRAGVGAAGGAGHGYADLGPAAGFIAVAATDSSEEILVAVVPHPGALP